jgi:hypothetical protein
VLPIGRNPPQDNFHSKCAVPTSAVQVMEVDHPSAGSSNPQRMIGMRVRELERVGDGAICDAAVVNIETIA